MKKFLLIFLCSLCLLQLQSNEPQQLYRIRMCWLPQAQFAGFFVAAKDNLYKNAGLNVIIDYPYHGENLFNSLKTGKIDFAIEWMLGALDFRSQGEPIINIGQFFQSSPEILVAKKSSGIRNVQDLSNRRIGIWANTSFHLPFIKFLAHNQVKNYRIMPILANVDMLLYDGVDAISAMTYNEYQQLIFAGFTQDELVIFKLNDLFPHLVNDGLYCMESTYQKNPETVKKIREATMEGWRRAFKDKKRTLRLIREKCLEHNRKSPETFAPFNYALQKRMLDEMEKIIAPADNDGLLKADSFKQGMQLLNLDSAKLKLNDFAPEARP